MKTILLLITLLITTVASFGMYDPSTGRWISRDPIGENGGWNLYAYCDNNPINRIDFLGLDASLNTFAAESKLHDRAQKTYADEHVWVVVGHGIFDKNGIPYAIGDKTTYSPAELAQKILDDPAFLKGNYHTIELQACRTSRKDADGVSYVDRFKSALANLLKERNIKRNISVTGHSQRVTWVPIPFTKYTNILYDTN